MSAVAKIWRDNKVLIVMGGILTMGHFVWRELQNNTAFVPAGMSPFKQKLVIIFSVRSEKYDQLVSIYTIKKLINLLHTGSEKEYPWIEIAKHVKAAQRESPSSPPPAQEK